MILQRCDPWGEPIGFGVNVHVYVHVVGHKADATSPARLLLFGRPVRYTVRMAVAQTTSHWWEFAPVAGLSPADFRRVQDRIAQRLYCYDPDGWAVYSRPGMGMEMQWSGVLALVKPEILGPLRFRPDGPDYRAQPTGRYRLGLDDVDLAVCAEQAPPPPPPPGPHIVSVVPACTVGWSAGSATIVGSNLATVTSVYIGQPADDIGLAVTSKSATQLTVRWGEIENDQLWLTTITVVTPAGSASSPFRVTAPGQPCT